MSGNLSASLTSPVPTSSLAARSEPVFFFWRFGALPLRCIELAADCFIFASLALAAVTRLHMLSISRAANLFRISSPSFSRTERRFLRVSMSVLNFSTFLASLLSSLRSVRSNDRSARRMAASTSNACFSSCFFISASSPVRLERQSSVLWLARLVSCFTLKIVSKLLLRWQLHFSKSLRVSAMSSLEACSAFFCSSGESVCDVRSFDASSPSLGASSAGFSFLVSLAASFGSFAASLEASLGASLASFPASFTASFVSFGEASPLGAVSSGKVTSFCSAFPFLGLLLAFGDLTGGRATCGDNVFISSIIWRRRKPVSSDKNFRLSLISSTIFFPWVSSSKSSWRDASKICFSEFSASVKASLNFSCSGRLERSSRRRSQTCKLAKPLYRSWVNLLRLSSVCRIASSMSCMHLKEVAMTFS
mmetsp:Transcript_59058/g.93460  ORF Transcript_59058/g.93460 Transcript_59058/m.93460 type:complete len:421 (-) Transcript_59058:333-1595(-)